MKAKLLLASALFLGSAALAQPAPAPAGSPADPSVLLKPWPGPHGGVPPFDRIRPEMFPPAFEAAMAEARADYAAIAGNPAAPSFANTIEAYEKAGATLDRVFPMFDLFTSNMNSADYQALEREWSPKFAAFADEIYLNEALFRRIDTLFAKRASLGLSPEQLRLLEQRHAEFVRRGARLDAAGKAKLAAMNSELAGLFTAFNQKVLADEETALTATEAEMKGVPEGVRSAAKAAAAERKLEGYAIVNTRSAVDPVLTFADDRALRERVWRAFVNRGDNGDANDTNATIAKIVKLRADRAKLLGFPSHAHWRMDDTMAKDPKRAEALMLKVWAPAKQRIAEEVADMRKIAGFDIAPWDYLYYAEKVRKARYDLDQGEIKPYFELNNMVNAAFFMANKLYGFDMTEVTGTVPVFHPDVRVFEAKRDGKHVALFYLDNYARTGKRSGAWMTAYRGQRRFPDVQTILASNNNNFTKGGPGEPVLISYDDANTLFHEFGHAIHFMLQDITYGSLGNVPRDFVEFPSQVHENWLLSREVLDRFARHYKTGEPMPAALVEKIQRSETFNQGYATGTYLASALVDMKLHTLADGVVDPDAFEREALAAIGMPKEIVMRHRLPQFSHLFSSDSYSAGYYSYLWSDVMGDDTWAAFEAAPSKWDRGLADRFRETLLSTGNVTDRTAAYAKFRGRDPSVDALLKQRGFPVGDTPAAGAD